MRNAYKILIGKFERNSQLGRPGCRQEDSIKIDLQAIELVWVGLNWLRIGTSSGLL
jgi:hypothetical protein